MSQIKDDILARVEESINGIRPYLLADGGDIRVLGVKGGTLKIELLGACRSCSMSPMTMKAGVEEAVKKSVPEIHNVIAVNLSELSE